MNKRLRLHICFQAVIVIAAWVLTSSIVANGQSTGGNTPLALSPGAPAGSYSLSDFDSVNLYNGGLNLALPLVKIAGRGGAGYTMSARIEQKWLVDKEPNPGHPTVYTPTPNWWNPTAFNPIYGLGRMDVRQAGSYQFSLISGCGYAHNQTLTRMTFSAPDGTEYELRGQGTNGEPKVPTSCVTGFNRGKVFVTADGSSATFTSDDDISDWPDAVDEAPNIPPSGILVTRDGTHYRIDGGLVSWLRDRNGNKLVFTYDTNRNLTAITDSLNRQVTISYGQPGAYDTISLKGFGGASRTIKVYRNWLNTALRSDFSLQTYHNLFPELNGASTDVSFNGSVITALELPNGRQYQFYYNSYGEVARVILPTGGAIEYDYAAGLTDGADSGVLPTTNGNKHVYRRVIERRVYPDGGSGSSYANRMTYSRPESSTANSGYVTTAQYNPSGTLLGRSAHYFYGSALASLGQDTTTYSGWEDGREYQTSVYAGDGTTELRRVTHTFAQRAAVSWWAGSSSQEPPNDPRLVDTDTTLVDTNQVSGQTFGYDDSVAFNNQNNVKEYDLGSGSAGSLVREIRTTFVTSSSYTDLGLLSLPSQVSIYDGGGVERARTTVEYDNYTSNSNHAGLLSRSNISGFDSSFGASYIIRGNPTATTHSLLVSGSVTGSMTSYAQYDIAGTVVKAIDARGNAVNIDFSDNFGAPTDTVESSGNPSNTAPSELGSSYAYAFPFAVTNALGQTSFTKFDFYLGLPVAVKDINGVISQGYYSDALDRPTQMTRAANDTASPSTKAQTTFAYDDTNHVITTTSDQTTYGDNVLKSSVVYDGMGRATEKRQYEGGTNYIAAQTQYDALGRAYKSSNPFRPWQSETALWTTTAFDVLGRVTSVTTPDSAAVSPSYSGNTVTVTDQAGKARKSVTDGLGRLIQVYEDPAGLNYLTSYSYDTVDNLTSVSQNTQPRTFVYDSLKRLTSAANPESGTISYQYDSNGNLTQKTDARSITTTYAYDALNRVTTRTYSDGTPTVTYAYDPNIANGKGRLASVSSSVSSYSHGNYDALGRVKSASQTIGSQSYAIGYSYDLAGHVISMTYPSQHVVNYSFDSAGRLSDFSGYLGDNSLRTYSTGTIYSPMGGMTKEQLGTTTPIYNKLFYNVRGQLSEIRDGTTYTGPADTGWERGTIINHYSDSCWGMCGGSQSTTAMTDNNGNLKTQQHWIQDGNGNVTVIFQQQYDYDSLNRLQKVSDDRTNPSWRQQYTYDRYGNRTIDQTYTFGTGIPKPNFGVDTNTNRLTVPSGQSGTMSYDSAGNLSTDTYSAAAVTRLYDAENRMTKETQASSYVAGEYSYDGDGRRIKRVVGGVETWQMYGVGGELIAEYATNADHLNPQKEYGYRNGQLLVTLTSPLPGGAPSFSDNPIQVGVTTVKATHITELRAAINNLRSHLGMSSYSWTTSATTNDYISANPILEMRTALDQALGAPAGGYASGLASGQPIKAIHIQELRDRLTAASGSDVRWMVVDQLGTPRMSFDQSGSLAATTRHDYLPFGEELFAGTGGRTTAQGYSVGDGVRQKFTGQQRDNETGLDYFEARYYASMQGRFTSVDPLMASADVLNPQTFNRYSYCGNSPINITDPTGEIWGVSGTSIQWFDDEDAMKAKGFTAYKALVGMLGNQLVALNPNANSYVSVAGAAEAVEQLVKWGAAGEAVVESGAVLGVSSTVVAILALGTLAPADAIDNRPEPVMGYSMSKSQLDYYYKLLENSNSQGSSGPASNTQGESSPANPNPNDNKPRYQQDDREKRQRLGNAPTNGQAALDRAVQVKSTSPRRVGVDPSTGEIVVFDRTQGNVYHGHVRSWDGLTRQMQNALVKSGQTNRRGNPQ